MSNVDLRRQAELLDWFHTIDLGQGIMTPGSDDSAGKFARLKMPNDLSGQRVLDIGAYEGFFSFAVERHGAAKIVAVDTLAWESGKNRGWPCFDLAHRVLGSKVEARRCDVVDLDRGKLGGFDLVLCLGVLYHLHDPLTALERIAAVTDDLLILETHTDATRSLVPAMAFYELDELVGA